MGMAMREASYTPFSATRLLSYIPRTKMPESPVVSGQDKVLFHEQCGIPTGTSGTDEVRDRWCAVVHYDISTVDL